MNRRPLLIAAIAVVVAVLTWLGLQDQNEDAPTESASTAPGAGAPTQGPADVAASSTPSPATDSETAPVDRDHEAGEDAVETLDEPVEAFWNPATRRSAEEAATAAMEAYTGHQATQEQWWKELEPLLTPAAHFVYSEVPHERIPASELTGEITVERTDSELLATATVLTNAGTYELVLTRPNGAADWLVDKIVPVEDR